MISSLSAIPRDEFLSRAYNVVKGNQSLYPAAKTFFCGFHVTDWLEFVGDCNQVAMKDDGAFTDLMRRMDAHISMFCRTSIDAASAARAALFEQGLRFAVENQDRELAVCFSKMISFIEQDSGLVLREVFDRVTKGDNPNNNIAQLCFDIAKAANVWSEAKIKSAEVVLRGYYVHVSNARSVNDVPKQGYSVFVVPNRNNFFNQKIVIPQTQADVSEAPVFTL